MLTAREIIAFCLSLPAVTPAYHMNKTHWNTEHTYGKTIRAFENSIRELKTDYLDLYLIHWPVPKDFRNDWQHANADLFDFEISDRDMDTINHMECFASNGWDPDNLDV